MNATALDKPAKPTFLARLARAILFPVRVYDNVLAARRWRHRNDLAQGLPFLEGIGVEFRVQNNNGQNNRLFVRDDDGVRAKLTRIGFKDRPQGNGLWPLVYWEKYTLAIEMIPTDQWAALCKAHQLTEIEYPTFERVFEVIAA